MNSGFCFFKKKKKMVLQLNFVILLVVVYVRIVLLNLDAQNIVYVPEFYLGCFYLNKKKSFYDIMFLEFSFKKLLFLIYEKKSTTAVFEV